MAASSELNHFQVLIDQTSVQVWASDAGSPTLQRIASSNFAVPLTPQGLIWIEDVHCSANKMRHGVHTFFWDNVPDSTGPLRATLVSTSWSLSTAGGSGRR